MWLGRYAAPHPLRCRGRFHLYSTTDANRPRVVVTLAEPPGDPAATACLDRLAAAHAALGVVPGIAALAERGEFAGQPFVAFSCDARNDGESLIARLGELRRRIPHQRALAMMDRLSSALAAAHLRHGELGEACCLGVIGWSNVLVGRDGALHWVGFGHNICALDETRSISGAPAVFVAPEVAIGGPATPPGDVHAFFQSLQALLPYAELPADVQRAFSGQSEPGSEHASAEVVRWLASRVMAAPPELRASLDEARALAADERRQLGITLDEPATLAWVRELLDAAEATPAARGERRDAWAFPADGAWFRRPDGETYEINSRPARRILVELISRRRREPGGCVRADQLVALGWPGEQPIREAGLNRAYVAVSTLRRLGLREIIERTEDGYRLSPDAAVEIDEL